VRSANAPAPIKARRDGYAASIANPIDGLRANRNPSDGISAAAVSKGDHCTVCAATIIANDAKTSSCGFVSVFRVSAHASSAAPSPMNKASARRGGGQANGIATTADVAG
jgi:hypothetical protein